MVARWISGALGLVILTSLGACASEVDEDFAGDSARVREEAFDKNAVLTDKALRDTGALTAADIQAFLDETPWGGTSVLAEYEEEGRTAAEIMVEVATKHDINPLELLVRVQMEQGLISKKAASDEAITLAFGCGCPHSPVCSPKYEGFANQAECAAGTLSRSMDRALTSEGTASGWKRGEEKLTQDRVSIVPANAATAALYTYTPWVGEAGGGRKGVGGLSLHHAVWTQFAEALGYGAVKSDTPREEPSRSVDAGAAPDAGGEDDAIPPDLDEDEVDAGAAPDAEADAGAPDEEPGESAVDAGGQDGRGEDAPSAGAESDGADDDDILSEGNVPPATNTPPPSRSGSSKARKKDDALVRATEEELRGSPKASDGGCSTSGGQGTGSPFGALVLAAAAGLVAKRRRP